MTRKIYGPVRFHVFRTEANFDKACELAWSHAVNLAGIDSDGYTNLIPEWERHNCELQVRFKGVEITQGEIVYEFSLTVTKNIEKEE